MVSDEDFAALQRRVDQLERVMTGADRDVAAIQAQRRADLDLLMALRGTQLQQGEQITAQGEQITALQGEMRAGFASIVQLLERLERPS